MKKDSLKKIFGFLFLMGLILISGCDKQKGLNPGWLVGTISIGPICPVEKIPPDPACLPTAETYKAYPVNIYTSNGKIKIMQLAPSLDGSFSAELPPGNYLAILETVNKYIGSSNLPAEVSVVSHENTLLSINIDTGIR
jgi:hypothetical protein